MSDVNWGIIIVIVILWVAVTLLLKAYFGKLPDIEVGKDAKNQQ